MSRYQFADRKSLPWYNLPVSGHDMTSASVVIIGGGFSGECAAFQGSLVLLLQNAIGFCEISLESFETDSRLLDGRDVSGLEPPQTKLQKLCHHREELWIWRDLEGFAISWKLLRKCLPPKSSH